MKVRHNQQQQADLVTVSPFVYKTAQKLPLLLRGCAGRMPVKIMNSAFYIVFFSVFLQGCTATFNGYLKNESDDEISVIPPFETDYYWRIDSGKEDKVNWYQECITIRKDTEIEYYSAWPIPENTVKNGLFSSSLNIVYKDNQLYFKTRSNELIKVTKVQKCSKA